MLNLTRKIGEVIVLQTSDGPIEILITKVNGFHIGLGIEAPKKVNVYRKELGARAVQEKSSPIRPLLKLRV